MKNKRVISAKKKNLLFFLFVVIVLCFIGIVVYKYSTFYKVDDRTKELKRFKEEYSDYETVGWLKVQGTNIDYPVIFNSSELDVSSIFDTDFVWSNSNNNKISNRVFIVGHNILNVSKNPIIGDSNHSRFEQLMAYIYYDFVEDNKYIQYTIDEKNYLYKIFSISFVNDSELDYYSDSFSEDEMEEYIEQSLKDSYFKFDVDVDEDDNIITLVTCTRMFGNTSNYTFKIDARMVRDYEFKSNYKVTEKDNYDEIVDIMEGDKKYEEI